MPKNLIHNDLPGTGIEGTIINTNNFSVNPFNARF